MVILMTAVVQSDTRQLAPNAGIKEIVILSSSACASGHTIDASSYFSTLWGVYVCDSTGAVKIATFTGTTITMGTLSTGVHCIRIWGV